VYNNAHKDIINKVIIVKFIVLVNMLNHYKEKYVAQIVCIKSTNKETKFVSHNVHHNNIKYKQLESIV